MKALVLLIVTLPAITACQRGGGPEAATKYTCSMHPSYLADRPGDCPVCGMKLVPVVPAPAPAPRPAATVKQTCPMHPNYVADRPGDCPICGMKLVPVAAPAGPPDAGAPRGFTAIAVAPEQARLLGLRSVLVRRAPLAPTLRTVGRVTLDETRTFKVQPRFDGFIEHLYADFTGKAVKKGERLAAIYAPELLATQEELLLAVRQAPSLRESGLPDIAEAARARLRLLGVGEAQIAAVEKAGRPQRSLELVAPVSGYVASKSAVAGGRVGPEMALFEIVDLSRVWILADVYETDLPRVRLGQAATVTLAYWPDRTWRGRVSWIQPLVDEKTRTVKVRIEVDNPRLELKPEMFADVVLTAKPRSAIVVPEESLIATGLRQLVFVVRGDGHLDPREVQVGERGGGLAEIRRGLAVGDQVALGASFLLDSESRLRAGLPQGEPAPDGGAR